MASQKDLLNLIAVKALECFQQIPVIVLGSGASAAHNIRGMPALSEYLKAHVQPANEEERIAWDAVCASLDSKVGLEQALQSTACPTSLVRQVVQKTHEVLSADDVGLLSRVINGGEKLHLADTLTGLTRSTGRTVSIITTNYDRIAEYSCDFASLAHWTGFTPG